MFDVLKKAITGFASLKLTVALFAMFMVLIFAGTLAQADLSNKQAVDQYFRSWLVVMPINHLAPLEHLAPSWAEIVSFKIWWPGGFSIGLAMLINLLSAHAIRFQLKARGSTVGLGLIGVALSVGLIAASHQGALGKLLNLAQQEGDAAPALWREVLFYFAGAAGVGLFIWSMHQLFARRSGIVILHLGVIALLISEPVTGFFAQETQMAIREGETVRYSHDIHEVELAVIDPASAHADQVAVIREPLIRRIAGSDDLIQDSQLPFDIAIERWMDNSDAADYQAGEALLTSQGLGAQVNVVKTPTVTGVDVNQEINYPAVIVRLSRAGAEVGRYVLPAWHLQSQTVAVDDKIYYLALRFRRYYKPYAIHLIDFRHDKFLGTNTARNFSSRVRLTDPTRDVNREVLIYMNHPLRYEGETFFQANFMSDDLGTVLSVVDNPGALIPYYSCFVVALGMAVHFVSVFARSARRVAA